MDLIPGIVLFIGAIVTVFFYDGILFETVNHLQIWNYNNHVGLSHLISRSKEGDYLIEEIMGEIQSYTSNSGDFNFTFSLIIVGIYLLYEIGKAISDNNDDDDIDGGIMMSTADEAQV